MYGIKNLNDQNNLMLVCNATGEEISLKEGLYLRDALIKLAIKTKVKNGFALVGGEQLTPIAHLLSSLGYEEHGSSSPGWITRNGAMHKEHINVTSFLTYVAVDSERFYREIKAQIDRCVDTEVDFSEAYDLTRLNGMMAMLLLLNVYPLDKHPFPLEELNDCH